MPCHNNISLYYRYSYLFLAPNGNFCVDKIKKPSHYTSTIQNLPLERSEKKGHKHITNYMRRAKEHREAIANI